MSLKQEKPVIGLLSTMTPIYRLVPSIREKMEKWTVEILKQLEEFSEIIYSGICDSREECAKSLKKIEQANADLLIVFPITYAPSLMTLPLLKRTKLPILVLNTQILFHWDSDAPKECFGDNQAPTGVFDLTNVLVRQNIPFEIISGHFMAEEMYCEIEEWVRAALTVKKIRTMKIGMLGYPMRGAGDLMVDPVSLLGDFGVDVIPVDLLEYKDLCENANESEVSAQIQFDKKAFEIDTSLTEDAHRESSRMEWGLRELIRKYNLSGLTFHFNALSADKRFNTFPMLGICKLLAEGIGFGGEGDVTSAALVASLAQLAGEADFFETWGMDFEGDAILKNHMGEGNYILARGDMPVRLVESPFGISDTVKYNVIPVFTSKAGEATYVSLTTSNTRKIKIITVEGTVPDFKPIEGVDSPHGKFKPDIGLMPFVKAYAHAGGSHHGALVYGKRSSLIQKMAELLGIEFENL